MLRSVLNSISRPFFIAVSPDVSESDNKNHMQYSRTQHIAHDIKNVSPSSGIDAKIQAVGKVLHEKSKDEKSKMASRFLESLPAKREDSNTAISINLGLQLNPAQFVLVTHQAAVHANDVGSALPLESNSQSSGVGGSASAIVPWYGISGLDR